MRNSVAPYRRNAVAAPQPFDGVFDGFFRNWPTLFTFDTETPRTTQGIYVQELEKEVLIHIDAPGFEANDFDIQFGENSLKIEAEHKPSEEWKLPFGHRKLTRVIELPIEIDHEKVEANYRSGVLSVKLAKAEKAQWKKVEVK